VVIGAGQLDPHTILARTAEATGHAPMWPGFASGYWQCKNRYATQAEILNISAEFKARQIPVCTLQYG
jgi:alpha-D-xyloside xylohydrolase